MKKIIIISSISFIFLCSIFGMLIAMNLIHELSHKQDFKHIAYNDSICLLEFGGDAIASYTFFQNNKIEYDRISKYTEIKAYGTSFVMFIVYISCLIVIFLTLIEINNEVRNAGGKNVKTHT